MPKFYVCEIVEPATAGDENPPRAGDVWFTCLANTPIGALDAFSLHAGFAPYTATPMLREVSYWKDRYGAPMIASAPFTNSEIIALPDWEKEDRQMSRIVLIEQNEIDAVQTAHDLLSDNFDDLDGETEALSALYERTQMQDERERIIREVLERVWGLSEQTWHIDELIGIVADSFDLPRMRRTLKFSLEVEVPVADSREAGEIREALVGALSVGSDADEVRNLRLELKDVS